MTASFSRHVLSLPLLLLLLLNTAHAFSVQRNDGIQMSSSLQQRQRGSAAKPFDKQGVAILGSGGYLGGTIFGFLQRCSSLYGSGIGRVRAIGATEFTLDCLNRLLGKHFVLAYAGEDLVRLTDMTDVASITQRVDGYSAVIMATDYYLEQRPVTGNTYETSPNSKTFEFYLDCPRRGMDQDDMIRNDDYQSLLFEHTLQACKDSNTVKHLLVIETPLTLPERAKKCAELLDESKLPFTYIKVNGSLENFQDYTFGKGIQGKLQLESFTFASDYTTKDDYNSGSWMTNVKKETTDNTNVMYREDVAALVVQCLQSLDWKTSRCIVVSSTGEALDQEFDGRLDKEWCVNSHVLAEKLDVVQ